MANTTSTTEKDTNIDLVEVYDSVCRNFDNAEKYIFNAQDAIGYSTLKQPTKTTLMKKFIEIWRNLNEIQDLVAKRGKI